MFVDDNIVGRKNIIPAIIDFWLQSDAEIKAFEKRYRNHPAVLISSKEVFDFLKLKQVDVNLFHWPLSLPDMYVFKPAGKKIRLRSCRQAKCCSKGMDDAVQQGSSGFHIRVQ